MSQVKTAKGFWPGFNQRKFLDDWVMLLAALSIFVLSALFIDNFLSPLNMRGLGLAISTVGIAACTMLFCLASGHFDLSVGSVIACVDEVIVFAARSGRRAHTQDAVLALQDDFAARGNVVGHQGRLADAQVDIGAVVDVLRHPFGQLFFTTFLIATHACSFCARGQFHADFFMPPAWVATRAIFTTWLT